MGDERVLVGGVLRVMGQRAAYRAAVAALVAVLPAAGVPVEVGDDERAADVIVRLDDGWRPPFEPRGIAPTGTPVDESFDVVPVAGRLAVTAGTTAGAYRALTVIAQMVTADRTLPLFAATDAPAWRWRGLSFDAVRAEFSLAELRAVVDLLALHRCNVLHLHLTDSQAWRLRIPELPALTPDGTVAYSADELRALHDYAAARFVTIVPEIDLPGHTHAALRAYPELIGDEPLVHPWLGHLRPNVPAAMRFTRIVVEALCALFPGPYVHIGGDEAIGMDPAEYAEFVTVVAGWVRELGKRPIAWQEAVRALDALGAGDVVQMWIGPGDGFTEALIDQLAASMPFLREPLLHTMHAVAGDVDRARRGDAALLVSSSLPYYLDRRYAEPSIDPAQNELLGRIGHTGYPPVATSELYATRAVAFDDFAGQPDRFAGIEAAIWAESIDTFDDLAALLLPRLAMFAEHLWSPDPMPWHEMVRAVRAVAPAWEALGFTGYYRSSEVFS